VDIDNAREVSKATEDDGAVGQLTKVDGETGHGQQGGQPGGNNGWRG